jgi:deoxyribodipyrimidine photolyase-related protein
MFVTGREQFHEWLRGHHAFMADFYRWQRERLGILLEPNGQPRGGRWSFDTENRKALPKRMSIPALRTAAPTNHVKDVIALVSEHFASHPGELAEASWWLPTTRQQANEWLDEFLERRLALFGPYEDALSDRDPFLFHSVLTPSLNLGLLTPADIVDRAIETADDQGLPLASIEGFVRQIIGWREFMRGMYRERSDTQYQSNFFHHRRSMTDAWRNGTTGLLPLDLAIRKAWRWGWTHHIERLMVLGNLMTLCEIEPAQGYRFFMEMYVDSSDWVMAPNVFGMGLFADGGSFATKPYICSSNYIVKMSDYAKPRSGEIDWCEILDGLYWRFISKHREFFSNQPRLQRTVALFDRLEPKRRERILRAAEDFLERNTHIAPN